MKKLLNNYILVALCIIVLGCSEESIESTSTIPQDVLSFDTKADFEAYMTGLVQKTDLSNANEYGIMSNVLNQDHIVQVGGYLIKVDLANETTFALNATYHEGYSDFAAGNFENLPVKSYSIHEDVLSLLEKSAPSSGDRASSYCPPAAFDLDTDSESRYFPGTGTRTITATAQYRSFGIYHTLSVNCTTNSGSVIYFESWDIGATNTACNTVYSYYGDYEDGDSDEGTSFYMTPYSSTSPLGTFHLYSQFSNAVGYVDVTIES